MAVTIEELDVEVAEPANPQGPPAHAAAPDTPDVGSALELINERALRLRAD